MASLPKPLVCPKCSGGLFRHMKQPERWECSGCETVVSSRPARIKGQCRRCPAKEGEVPFKKGKNLCLTCYNETMKEWRQTSETWKAKKKDKSILSKRQMAVRKCVQKTPEVFIHYLLRMLGRQSRYKKVVNKDLRKNRLNPACLDVQIDFDHLLALWSSQDGRCAISGLPMVHKFNDLCTVSIDRKDSTVGYVPGNVQLVCQWVNKAKGNKSDGEMLAVLEMVRSSTAVGVLCLAGIQ